MYIYIAIILVNSCLMYIPEELVEMFKSVFLDVHHVSVVSSALSPAPLLNLVSTLERMNHLYLQLRTSVTPR